MDHKKHIVVFLFFQKIFTIKINLYYYTYMCMLAFLQNEFRFERHTKQSFFVDGNM